MQVEAEKQDAAQKVLVELLETVKRSKDFVIEQLPDVVQQWLAYERLWYVFWTGFCFGLVFAFYKTAVKCIKQSDLPDISQSDKEDHAAGAVICGICAAVFSVVSMLCFIHVVKLYVAPKVCVIEWLMTMVRQ